MRRAFLVYAALSAALGVAYFPSYFNSVTRFDDEGAYVVTLREFLRHGSLYVDTHAPYGPFYYTVVGLVYRLTGQTPSLFNGRLIALAMTTVSSIFLAATVWRVTRSLVFGALCQVVSYSILATVTSDQPLHPGQLIVLLLSVMSYTLATYAMTQRTGSWRSSARSSERS